MVTGLSVGEKFNSLGRATAGAEAKIRVTLPFRGSIPKIDGRPNSLSPCRASGEKKRFQISCNRACNSVGALSPSSTGPSILV